MATGLMGKIGSALGMQSGAGPLNVRFNVMQAEGIRSLENAVIERIYFAVSVAGTGGSRAKTNDLPFQPQTGAVTLPQGQNSMLLHCAPDNQILFQCYRDVRLLPDHLLGECYFPLSSLLNSAQPQWVNLQRGGQQTGRVLLGAVTEGPTPGVMGQGANMPGQTTYTGQTAGMPQSVGGMGAAGTTMGSTGTGMGTTGIAGQQGMTGGMAGQQFAGGQQAGLAGQQGAFPRQL